MNRSFFLVAVLAISFSPAQAAFDWSQVAAADSDVQNCLRAEVGENVVDSLLSSGRPQGKKQRRKIVRAFRECQGSQRDGSAVGTRHHGKLSLEEQQAVGLIATGLRAKFPDNVRCEGVSSPFGSRTRYDGSNRVTHSNNGYHGGMDLSLKTGTPLLAAADGVVINISKGGRLVGHVIWMQHSPDDTGLPFWTYTKYQHLKQRPTLKVGQRFKAGDVVAISGDTGTTGGHYGHYGYPHLHMNVYASDNDRYKVKGHKVRIDNRRYLDPLAFYLDINHDSRKARAMSEADKDVKIPVKLEFGEHIPADSRRVWPVYCAKS